jgi:hypothetical protein
VGCTACGQWHYVSRADGVASVRPYEDTNEPISEDGSTGESGTATAIPPAIDEELARIDQAWEWERKNYLVFGLSGEPEVPGLLNGVLFGLVPVLGGLVVLYFTGGDGFSNRLIGLGLVLGGIAFGVYRVRQALAYQQAQQRYQSRRRASVRVD